MASVLKTKTETTEVITKTFVKKAFGTDKLITITCDAKGIPVIFDENNNLILGILPKLFKSELATTEESKTALLEYKIVIEHAAIEKSVTKIEESKELIEDYKDEIEAIKTGTPSVKALDREEAKLMKKLEAIQAKKKAVK